MPLFKRVGTGSTTGYLTGGRYDGRMVDLTLRAYLPSTLIWVRSFEGVTVAIDEVRTGTDHERATSLGGDGWVRYLRLHTLKPRIIGSPWEYTAW